MIRLAVRVAAPTRRSCSPSCSSSCPSGLEERDAGPDAIEYVIYGAPGEVPDLGDLRAVGRAGAGGRRRPREVPDDWAERWKAWHRPVDVSWRFKRLRVRPPWEPPLDGDGLELVIDPGQAFGTGAHHTTRLCLELLLGLEPEGALADWGCGTGVLAIAAARLGFAPVAGVRQRPERARGHARERGGQRRREIAVESANLRRAPGPWAPTVVREPRAHAAARRRRRTWSGRPSG